MNNRPLQRSRQDRMIAGVLAGLADWLGWDVTALRIAFVVISLLSSVFPGILVYVVLWILMPEEQ
ncbi:MAG: PspC domain-containing protein [Fidelibacterota bacterium]